MSGKRDPWAGFEPTKREDLFSRSTGNDAEYQTRRLREILSKFRPSLVERAKERLSNVRVIDGGWVVLGDSSKGDAYESYQVTQANGKYHCQCFETRYGEVRKHNLCSHILAVIIHRYTERGAQL